MKKLISCVAIIMSCYTVQAQSLTLNNNVAGDVYFRVYIADPATPCNLLGDFVEVMVPSMTIVAPLNLANGANWNGGTAPAPPYVFVYAEVSRDPSCPGSAGWGSAASGGGCNVGTPYYDQVTVGNNNPCSYNTQDCMEISTSATNCSGFTNGNMIGVVYTDAGSGNVVIDILP